MKRHATAIWQGALKDGHGTLISQSSALESVPYSFKARFEDESGKSGTNPEELIAAAHSGCFAMQLSHLLAENGTPAETLDVTATIDYGPAEGGGFQINSSNLKLKGRVAKIDEATFQKLATTAKDSCPVSKALGKIEITLDGMLA